MARFLASPGSDNAELGELLAGRQLHWLGPVQVSLERLNRLAGPPGEPVLCPVDDDYWGDDVDAMEHLVEEGWEPPPMIATYDDGQLLLEDGNHRVESLRRNGVDAAWTIIGFETAEARDQFTD